MRSTYYGNYDYMDRVEEMRFKRIARTRQVRRQKLLIIIGVLITMAFISFFDQGICQYKYNFLRQFRNQTVQECNDLL